jgi:hypothetical protein
MADQSFMTAPTGERLFYRGGPWSRPYIIPDQETERRLYRKQLWTLRVLLGVLIVGQPFLFALVPEVWRQPVWFLLWLATTLAAIWAVGFLVFRPELCRLRRVPARLPLRSFFEERALRNTACALWAGLAGSLLFVAAGVLMLLVGENPVVAVSSIVFFAACGLAWGYSLRLKCMQIDPTGDTGEDHRA